MSMHALTSRKVSNKDTQIHNRFSQFTKPIGETGDVNINGNLSVSGTIYSSKYLPGQIVNVSILSNTDLNQLSPSQTVNVSSTKTIFTYSYTPKIANSYIIIEYQTINYSGGSANDEIYAYLYSYDSIDNRIGTTYQKWMNGAGGGTRSGTLFPIVGRYTNTDTNSKTIRVDINNNGSNDQLTVNGDNSTWLKITEIGR